ncbi:hypothetical protein FB451DRAFT_80581, partial [Mycena latifolia]
MHLITAEWKGKNVRGADADTDGYAMNAKLVAWRGVGVGVDGWMDGHSGTEPAYQNHTACPDTVAGSRRTAGGAGAATKLAHEPNSLIPTTHRALGVIDGGATPLWETAVSYLRRLMDVRDARISRWSDAGCDWRTKPAAGSRSVCLVPSTARASTTASGGQTRKNKIIIIFPSSPCNPISISRNFHPTPPAPHGRRVTPRVTPPRGDVICLPRPRGPRTPSART